MTSSGSLIRSGARTALLVAALLAVHAALAVTSVREKSATYDEIGHVFKGLAIWTAGDFRFMPENPHLAQAWATLPLLDDGLELPRRDQQSWYRSDFWRLGDQLFHELGNDPAAILLPARCMIVALSVALGLVVFLCSRRLFGTAGGLTSLTLYALSPSILAHARLVTADLVVSLCLLLALLAQWRVMRRMSWATLLAGGVALGCLAVSKMSAGVIVPMTAVLFVVRTLHAEPLRLRLRREVVVTSRPGRLAWYAGGLIVQLLVAWAVLWAAHGFRYEAMVDAQPDRDRFLAPLLPEDGVDMWEHQARGMPVLGHAVDVARRAHLLPEAWLYGFLTAMQGARGRDAFLDGERSLHGFAWFFPRTFLYKVPLPSLALMLLAVVALVSGRARVVGCNGDAPGSRGESLYRTAPFWVLVGVYWAIAIPSNINIGLRHLLPVMAPTFVLCGAVARWPGACSGWRRYVVPALLTGLAGVNLATWPNYLASFNLIAGGPAAGYRHLVDSSLDWGQDLPGLATWLEQNAGDERVYISYFGTADWRHAGIAAQHVPYGLRADGAGDYELKGGLYCISATRLQQLYTGQPTRWTDEQEAQYQRLLANMRRFEQSPDDAALRSDILRQIGPGFKAPFDEFQLLRFARLCAWLRTRDPDAQVGHSILIYALTDEDIETALYR